jgi:hypothetical protein
VLNKVLKKTINQQRPDGVRLSTSGMPSAHSQFISFFASYAVAYTYSKYVCVSCHESRSTGILSGRVSPSQVELAPPR